MLEDHVIEKMRIANFSGNVMYDEAFSREREL